MVRYFLEKTWGGKAIDERLWADAVAAARAPGAHHAPLHFLSGGLFSADILSVYESQLSQDDYDSVAAHWDCRGRAELVWLPERAARPGKPRGGVPPIFRCPPISLGKRLWWRCTPPKPTKSPWLISTN